MIERQAVRALLLNPQEELLLIKIVEPQSKRAFWITPGGGIHTGESPAATLRREVFEETGLTDFEIGPEVWQREHRFTWDGRVILQREQFYVVKVNRFEPTTRHLPDQIEQDVFGGFHWWTAKAIEQSPELFAPKRLARLLHALIEQGPPASPIVLRDYIGLYQRTPATHQPYDPRATEAAKQVADLISADLPSVQVEHVGSTAVPGCAGKGIVDLMILYPDGFLEMVKKLLADLGFQPQTGRDPFPEERPMRVGSIEHHGTVFKLHAHVISAGSPEAAELRLFRDRLRADPELRAAYVARKQEILASGVSDSIDYAIIKGAFVRQALDSMKPV